MSDVSSVQVFWTPILEMLVEGSVVPIPVQTGLLRLRPSSADIRSASNIKQLTAGIVDQIHEPDHLVLHASR